MWRLPRLFLVLGTCGLLIFAGCGDDGSGDGGGGVGFSEKGLIEIEPNVIDGVISVDTGQVSIGGTIDYEIQVRNVSDVGMLTLHEVSLTYNAPDGGDSHGPAFVLEPVPANTQLTWESADSDLPTSIVVKIKYTRQESFESRSATLVIRSDSRQNDVVAVTFVAVEPSAVAQVSPAVLDFGTVKQGDVGERFVKVANTGSSTLLVTGFALQGHPDFTLHLGDKSYPVSEVTQARVEIEEPVAVEPNLSEELRITFAPQTSSPASGQLTLFTNDAKGQDDGYAVVLISNNDVPCIEVEPQKLLFGGKVVGNSAVLPLTITNCGGPDLKISGVKLADGSDADFAIYSGPSGFPPGDCDAVKDCLDIDPTAPLVIPVNDSIDVEVRYVPSVVSPLDADNKPIPDEATLVVENNSFEALVEVPISGTGVEVGCPIAVASVEEGEQVVPQTTLHLKGDQSYSPAAGVGIKNYEWSVEQPEGSASILIPNASFDNPVFEVNAAGEYAFTLNVRDDNNVEACELAVVDVIVIPDEAIHVELLWKTESDLDPNDIGEGNGTDMDLHFAHPFATGPDIDGDGEPDPWFDEPFDCFWFNKEPNWGTFAKEVDDNPGLDRDDIDGWGPENLNLNIPENVTYRVGVHFWDGHEFDGESLASVRIFVYGEMVEEVLDVPMVEYDMWYFGLIHWQPGLVEVEVFTDEAGDYLMTPNYQNPIFVAPE